MNSKEEEEAKIQLFSLSKLGMSLLVLSIIVVAIVAYFLPSAESIFKVTILKEGYDAINILIRLYAGFLASSAIMYLAQFVLWVLMKSSIHLSDYTKNQEQVKTVRTFSVVAVGLLFAALFLFAGMTVVRL